MINVIHGDCLVELPKLEADSIDSCVTDPPYHLTSIVKRFGKAGSAPAKGNEAFKRASAGFMGKQWDGGDIAHRVETWEEVYRVLKPGAHLLAFSSTRTYHRMVCAIDDAGFEIRDQVVWMYGSGFPKSHSVSAAIDKMNGEARKWKGWGTALKPALEPVVLARKPISENSIAANVLEHGTGALNIDACRVACTLGDKGYWPITHRRHDDKTYTLKPVVTDESNGRWPANVCHDGSPEVLAEFAKYGESKTPTSVTRGSGRRGHSGLSGLGRQDNIPCFGDSGTPARFFYSAKADKEDRLGSKHPTVKPVDLMRWLVRMITPSGGTVLDPFGGSGTTAMAAMAEGFNATIIELEAQSVADIKHRITHVKGDDTPLFAAETREPTLL